MPSWLSIEASSGVCSASLCVDGLFHTKTLQAGNAHSRLLLGWVDGLLAQAGIPPTRLDGILYGMGPGAFTGVRIACAAAQGLAYGWDLPVLGVCNLASTACAAGDGIVAVVNDARMGECYRALYRVENGRTDVLEPPELGKPGDTVPWARRAGATLATGNAVGLYGMDFDIPSRFAAADARNHIAWLLANPGQAHWVPPGQAPLAYVRNRVALTIDERAKGERL